MTENKRFELIPYADITYGLFDWVKKEYIAEHLPIRFEGICDILNELYDENQEVFDSIDNRLRYYQEFLENEKRNDRDIMLLQRIVDDLKDLKRIKKGDDLNG